MHCLPIFEVEGVKYQKTCRINKAQALLNVSEYEIGMMLEQNKKPLYYKCRTQYWETEGFSKLKTSYRTGSQIALGTKGEKLPMLKIIKTLHKLSDSINQIYAQAISNWIDAK
jgi:hypothetical protein